MADSTLNFLNQGFLHALITNKEFLISKIIEQTAPSKTLDGYSVECIENTNEYMIANICKGDECSRYKFSFAKKEKDKCTWFWVTEISKV